jgi:hypothetical protein
MCAMRADATTFDELFAAAGKYEDAMRRMDALIVANAPKFERRLFIEPSMVGIGYGSYPAHTPSSTGTWPLIGMLPQKNNVSLYVSGEIDGLPVLVHFDTQLGKVSCGKTCMRFTKYDNLNEAGVRELIRAVARIYKSRENVKK